jgi:hypothetical protein
MFRRKTVAAILIPVVVLMIACCLPWPFSPGASDVDRQYFEPQEQCITTKHYTLELDRAYWENQRAGQITTNPLEAKVIEENVLVLEITVANHLAERLDLICFMEDASGYTYSPDFEADRSAFDEGNVFIPSFQPLETVQASMEFHSLTSDNQELWLHCGLCDNRHVCIEGRLQDVAIQIR